MDDTNVEKSSHPFFYQSQYLSILIILSAQKYFEADIKKKPHTNEAPARMIIKPQLKKRNPDTYPEVPLFRIHIDFEMQLQNLKDPRRGGDHILYTLRSVKD